MMRHLHRVMRLQRSENFSTCSIRPKKLDGRVAVVIGGTKGTGLDAAKRLAEDGARVVVSSRTEAHVDNAVNKLREGGLEVSGMVCHVSKSQERQELLKYTESEFGGIDILVQNAAVNPHPWNIMETPGSVIDKVCEMHIKANFQLVQEVQPYMAKRAYQSSIILVSTVGAYLGHIFPGIYVITKASIITMARAFMSELLKDNIRINCVSYGGIDTEFGSKVITDKRVVEIMMNDVPMRRLGRPEECGGVVAFLCSDDASYITGENFVIAGGQYTRF